MTEDIQLNMSNTKLPSYEQIDGSAPPRRRRFGYFLAAVALVLTIVAVGVYSAGSVADASEGGESTATGIRSEVPVGSFGTCTIPEPIRKLTIGGIERTYKIVLPAEASFPTSLIVAYHGIASDVTKIEGKMQLQTNAKAKRSILVYPEAKNKAGGILDPASFNGAGCCKDHADWKDEEFFAAIIADLKSTGCVDGSKVYVMGFSNGGFMTNRLACAEATRDLVTAACVHSGLSGDYGGVLANAPWMHCAAKPVLSIHGTSDNTVPIAGGKNPLTPARWFSQDEVIEMWANAGRCEALPTVTEGLKTHKIFSCGTHSVQSIKHDGFGHDWHPTATDDCMTFFDAHGR